jgi:hypothetical protein
MRRKVSSIQNGLGVLDYESLTAIQEMLEDGVQPESDEQMIITEVFLNYENPFVKELSLSLSALEQCERALRQEIGRRDDDLRNSADYDKAINFLEVACGSTLDPDWQNLERTLKSSFSEPLAEVAIEDAKVFDDPEKEPAFF